MKREVALSVLAAVGACVGFYKLTAWLVDR